MSQLLVSTLKSIVLSPGLRNGAIIQSLRVGNSFTTSIPRMHDDHSKAQSDRPISPRMEEFKKKLREKTPIGKLDEIEGKHPYEEKEPLPAWPDNTNPNTGEVGGPRGPEPTRYGDWERKGRVSDF